MNLLTKSSQKKIKKINYIYYFFVSLLYKLKTYTLKIFRCTTFNFYINVRNTLLIFTQLCKDGRL